MAWLYEQWKFFSPKYFHLYSPQYAAVKCSTEAALLLNIAMEAYYVLLFIKKKASEFHKNEKLVFLNAHYVYCITTLPEQ